MGDIVATLSYFLKTAVKSDCHIIFHYPPDHGYPKLIKKLMDAFSDTPYKITYEVNMKWYSVSDKGGISKFGEDGQFGDTLCEYEPTWWFTGTYFPGAYHPFERVWKENRTGPIALALNHEFFNQYHPIASKFFNEKINAQLLKKVDNKNYFSLGQHHTFENNVAVLANCRYVVGIEGGWTHVCNAMRVPFICVTNERHASAPLKVHAGHPCLKVIQTNEMMPYINGIPENLISTLVP